MFDNLLYQPVTSLLETDIAQNQLPQSILLSGKEATGKLTCALEIARVLDCTGNENGIKGFWTCQCPSCLQHKQLSSSNLIITGPRDCVLEIGAAKKTLINGVYNNASYLMAVRYLFLRSVRKLTLRFSPVLWEDDDKASKVAALISAIDEDMEEILPTREVPEITKLEKLLNSIEGNCQKLESSFLYTSLPVSQVRKLSAWTRLTTSNQTKKTIIIENADKMQEEDGSPFTAHTTNLVPFVVVGKDFKDAKLRDGGILADVAPTFLDMMGVEVPAEMTGKSLLVK